MAGIPLPALDIKPQQSDPLESYGRLVQLKSLLQNQKFQQQMQPMQMQQQQEELKAHQLANQQAQQQMDQVKALNAGYQSAITMTPNGPTFDRNKLLQSVTAAGQGSVAPKLIESLNAMDKSAGDVQKLKDEHNAAALDYFGNLANAVKQNGYTPEAMGIALAHAAANGYPQEAQQFQQQLGQNPGAIKNVVDGIIAQSTKQRETGTKEAEAGASIAGKIETARHNVIEEQQGKGRLGVEYGRLAEEKRHNRQSEGAITPDALKMAADQFAATGQMPQMGRSTSIRTQIMNQAALDHPKVDLASNAAAYKANASSLKNVTGTLDTLTAFESTGLKNLKQFTDLAEKIPDTGVPWLNTPVRMLNRNMVGDANMAAVEAARNVALREIARVTNDPKLSGTLTDSSRHEVSGLIPQNATFSQIKAVAKVLQQDMANVHQSLEEQRNAIKGRISTSDANGASQPKQAKPQPQSGSGDFFSQYGGKKLNQ